MLHVVPRTQSSRDHVQALMCALEIWPPKVHQFAEAVVIIRFCSRDSRDRLCMRSYCHSDRLHRHFVGFCALACLSCSSGALDSGAARPQEASCVSNHDPVGFRIFVTSNPLSTQRDMTSSQTNPSAAWSERALIRTK